MSGLGHPLFFLGCAKTRMPGTRPGMAAGSLSDSIVKQQTFIA
jgi:hypothetical protein